jgi:hypothetical protein
MSALKSALIYQRELSVERTTQTIARGSGEPVCKRKKFAHLYPDTIEPLISERVEHGGLSAVASSAHLQLCELYDTLSF